MANKFFRKEKQQDPTVISDYGSIESRTHELNHTNFRELINTGTICTAVFALADFTTLFLKFDQIQNENWYLVLLLSGVAALTLDVPLAIAGKKTKEYLELIISRSQLIRILCLSILCFLIVYIPTSFLSMATKDAVFSEPNNQVAAFGFSEAAAAFNTDTFELNSASDAVTDSGALSAVTVGAVFTILLPAATSVASFIVGLITYHPTDERLKKLNKARLKASEQKIALEVGMTEINGDDAARKNELKSKINDSYQIHVKRIKAQEGLRIQAYLQALEERINDVEGILDISEEAKMAAKALNEMVDVDFKSNIADGVQGQAHSSQPTASVNASPTYEPTKPTTTATVAKDFEDVTEKAAN